MTNPMEALLIMYFISLKPVPKKKDWSELSKLYSLSTWADTSPSDLSGAQSVNLSSSANFLKN